MTGDDHNELGPRDGRPAAAVSARAHLGPPDDELPGFPFLPAFRWRADDHAVALHISAAYRGGIVGEIHGRHRAGPAAVTVESTPGPRGETESKTGEGGRGIADTSADDRAARADRATRHARNILSSRPVTAWWQRTPRSSWEPATVDLRLGGRTVTAYSAWFWLYPIAAGDLVVAVLPAVFLGLPPDPSASPTFTAVFDGATIRKCAAEAVALW